MSDSTAAVSGDQQPSDWQCAISQELMRDPVIGPDGYTQERASIEEWLRHNAVSPMTRTPMRAGDLIPNRALANTIHEALSRDVLPAAEGGAAAVVAVQDPEVAAALRDVSVVLCVDVSGSMSSSVALPDDESDGLSRLDLVKHSLRTLLASLGDGAEVSVVEFTTDARVSVEAQKLSPRNRAGIEEAIKDMRPQATTNLYAGLRLSLEESRRMSQGRMKHIVVFTDGHSNADPPRGLLNTLEGNMTGVRDVCIHTLGFGYDLNSRLLHDVAWKQGGVFGFIPDATMIGTVFINLGVSICVGSFSTQSLQTADSAPLRHLRSILDVAQTEGRVAAKTRLDSLMTEDVWGDLFTCEEKDAVMQDLYSDDPNAGQIGKAVSREDWWRRWGEHQVLSMRTAHTREICLNFKDMAIRIQKAETPQFDAVQAVFEENFLGLPAPVPSNPGRGPLDMTGQQNAAGGCFAGWTAVWCVDDQGSNYIKSMHEVRPRDRVMTETGVTRVQQVVATHLAEPAVIYTPVASGWETYVGLTPWHPQKDVNGEWRFPAESPGSWATPPDLPPVDTVQNLVLENRGALKCRDLEQQAATLGHGLRGPVIEHPYFGTDAVVDEIRGMCSGAYEGVVHLITGNIVRGEDGRVTSFRGA